MPSNPTTTDMGALHETYLAEIFGGTKTGSSGNQWDDQLDGYNAPDAPFSFRWDGKSTKGKSIAVTLEMIAKVIEQAQGYRPAIPLRWYGNEKLTEVTADWVALKAVDLSELLEAARAWVELEAALGEVTPASVSELLMNATEHRSTIERLQRELHDLREDDRETTPAWHLESLRAQLAEAEGARDRYKALYETRVQAGDPLEGRAVPGYVPRLPWTVVHGVRNGSATVHSCIHYDPTGHQHVVPVESVRIDRSPDSFNRPWLMVNDRRVPDGALYQDGLLVARVCAADRSIEVG